MTHTWTVPLRGVTLPRRNEMGKNWQAAHRHTSAARLLSRNLALSERNRLDLPAATGKRRVAFHLVRGPGQRLLDDGNMRDALKPILDGLTSRTFGRFKTAGAGWLVDDSPAWVVEEYTQVIDRRMGPAVIVTVSDVL